MKRLDSTVVKSADRGTAGPALNHKAAAATTPGGALSGVHATRPGRVLRAIGLMSGTSLDGIDAALIETDGVHVEAMGAALTVPYASEFRARLRGLLGHRPEGAEAAAVAHALTEQHAVAVGRLLTAAKLEATAIDVIGFHGHTVLHRPAERLTCQLGDGGQLARLTGIPVVADLRQADVAAGGHGAPLAPLYHAALANPLAKPLAVLNLGGVGNLTWIGSDGTLLAFDTGPANALIDDWVAAKAGLAFDRGGALAATGKVDAAAVERFLAHPWFAELPPKSLDRLDFADFAAGLVAHLGVADGAATLAAFTVGAVLRASRHLPQPPLRWLVVGGGRHNAHLMARLAMALGTEVTGADEEGWAVDALEAQAFGFLAVRSVYGLALSLPGTTGVAAPLTGGCLHPTPDGRLPV